MLLNAVKNIFLSSAKNGATVNTVNLSGTTKTIPGGYVAVWGNLLIAICGGSVNGYHAAGYGAYIEVGFGDTPESVTDYNLADSNKDNPKLTYVAGGKNAAIQGDINNLYANFRNDSGTNVTVREVGIVGNGVGNSSGDFSEMCLFFRKVLETPVTIAPGETYSFSYRVRFKS